MTDPCRPSAGHAWAYLPDFAEAVARLVARDGQPAAFETFHFEGHWFEDGRDMAKQVRRAAGNEAALIKHSPWRMLHLAKPFVPVFREMAEMQYLWQVPVRLDNCKLLSALGSEPHRPIHVALKATLEGLDCLGSEARHHQMKGVSRAA